MANYRVTELTKSLPATVPFVGPETQERARGGAFDARIGANECVFGPSPMVVARRRSGGQTERNSSIAMVIK